MGHTLPTPPLTTSGPTTTTYLPHGPILPLASTATSSPWPNTTTLISSNNEPTTTTPTNLAAHQSALHHLTAQPQSTASIPNIDPVPARTHTIITRSQWGIVKPLEYLSLHTSFVSLIPKSPFLALKDENWCNSMYDEYNVLVKNGTWILVLRLNDANLQLGIDFDETFSPVVKPTTIRTTLSLVVSRKWPIYQLDVKNAFLNGDLSKTVYMHQPLGFDDSHYPQHVCLLQRSLYGLKQAPRLTSCLFTIYADDIILTASSIVLLQQIIDSLHKVFDMTDLGALNYLLGIFVGTLVLGLHLYASTTTSLVGYTDADWAGCPSTRSAKAKYRGVANVVAETTWLHNLLRELHSPLLTATLVYYDNVSAVYMSTNPVQHQRTKHIEIDTHFVCDIVKAGHVQVLHVPS
ncbi:ribonuclease H-like domain-containing protein [Tanacetum coccineum]